MNNYPQTLLGKVMYNKSLEMKVMTAKVINLKKKTLRES